MGRTPTDLAGALAAVSARPTPALVWRDGPERVELSGRVLVNWVEKSAGLLVDELDVTAGDVVRISPVPHWRLVVLTLAALRVGARVAFDPELDAESEAVVHAYLETAPEDPAAGATALVVAAPALAFACSQPLPGGAVDFCDEVRGMGDVYTGFEEPEADDAALPSGLTHGELVAAALESLPGEHAGETVFVPMPDGWDETQLLRVLGAAAQDGAVLMATDPGEITGDVLAQEHATAL
ncbi:hypothetical protein KVA01_04710 [Kocuria varians]|uniref:TIGR03089 family protein n=1 Tax=Kocuria varians TaxID=1272 RepID=A0A4Y4D144_KOCVA|nr:TIGR03089 family protein [Kocuria varians]GEC98316.1 hypothetical protein KVA01_04710 [Kocuria varians]